MFSTELALTLEAAFREASTRSHAFFTVEHLLFALLHDDSVRDTLRHCGADLKELKRQLETHLTNEVEKLAENSEQAGEPAQTPAVQRVLQRAILHMHSSGKEFITPIEVLIALFEESDTHALYFLKSQEISRLDVLNYVSHGISKVELEPVTEDEEEAVFSDEEDEDGAFSKRRGKKRSALEQYTENLTDQARAGVLDPIIGREQELNRAIKILCRRQKNNPLFLGEPGVGKTAMAHALAQKIVSGEVPERLQDAEVFVLQMSSLIAGTKFRGEFENRIKGIVSELERLPNAILFIDEIHTLVGTGATGSSSMDAANLLKPILSGGSFRCMGSTTYEDFKKHFEKDRGLNRRFSKIDLDEPSVEEAIKILEGLKSRFEEFHRVRFTKDALRAAVKLSAKHISERFLPDKAIDVIDEAGAANDLLPPSAKKKKLSAKEIELVVSEMAKVPIQSVSSSDEEKLQELESRLKRQVFGQDRAVEAIAMAIKRGRASLKLPDKPLGSYLFAGPTGVGKTELARVLARELGVPFHRFDMSEYMEKHAVARLIGAPPGYVGYEEGGLLIDLVRKQPYSVLLLDEIEKAHEDIYNILLQVMDAATLTDSQGRKADFRNVILIMTTNAGSQTSASIGFGQRGSSSNREAAIKKLFKPEFRNRLDEVIYFQSLPPEVILEVVEKFIAELRTQLLERKVSVAISDEAKALLAKQGFDEQLGARPMARVIQREIKDKITDELLFGKLKQGGKISVQVEGEKLTVSLEGKNSSEEIKSLEKKQ